MDARAAHPERRPATVPWTRDVPRADVDASVGAVRGSLVGRRFEAATEIAVLRGETLVGLAAIEDVLAADASTRVAELARPALVMRPDEDVEVVTRRAVRAGARTVAVVAGDDRFLGVVSSDALLLVLEVEHEEDIARLGGFLSNAQQARSAADEAVGRRLWHRLPWLALGLGGAMVSAIVVASFEETLRREVALAFFVPAVVYMADAVGTQTEAVVIRGMSLGVTIGDVLWRELATGLIVGLAIGALFFPFALLIWGSAAVAASVAIALLVSCSVATCVAMALPFALARLGGDPAFGSGPLATVVQDLLSVIAYFAVATALVD